MILGLFVLILKLWLNTGFPYTEADWEKPLKQQYRKEMEKERSKQPWDRSHGKRGQ